MNLYIESFTVTDQDLYSQLVQVLCRLFSDSPELCEQFWVQDYPLPDRRSVLDSARARFPFETPPLIQLLSSLAADLNSALYVYRYARSIPTVAVQVTEECLEKTSSGALFLRKSVGLVPYSPHSVQMEVPAGSPVQILAPSPLVVQVECSFSLFHLMLSFGETYLQTDKASRSSVLP